MDSATAQGAVQTAQTYTGFGELATLIATNAGTPLYDAAYTRDAVGRITRRDETVAGAHHAYDYTYDAQGRLADVKQDGVDLGAYGYDANGNRVSIGGQTVARYNDQDRLLAWGDATYTYTANGELASKTTVIGTTHYTYDVLGNLREVQQPDGTDLQYVIDGQGRRIGKKVNGALVQGFLYQDALKPVAELDGQGNVVARFVYGTRMNAPDYMIKGGKTYRIIADQLGSPRLVVDTATGEIAQQPDYDAWGRITQDTNPGFQPFGFAGGLYDRDIGLIRFGARDYDPEVGRWTAKDPIGFAGQDTDVYAYVQDNPLIYVDPLGLAWQLVIGGGGTVIVPFFGGGLNFNIGINIDGWNRKLPRQADTSKVEPLAAC